MNVNSFVITLFEFFRLFFFGIFIRLLLYFNFFFFEVLLFTCYLYKEHFFVLEITTYILEIFVKTAKEIMHFESFWSFTRYFSYIYNAQLIKTSFKHVCIYRRMRQMSSPVKKDVKKKTSYNNKFYRCWQMSYLTWKTLLLTIFFQLNIQL